MPYYQKKKTPFRDKWARLKTTSTKTPSRSFRSGNSRTQHTVRSRRPTQVNGQSHMNTGSIASSIRALELERRLHLVSMKSSQHSTEDSKSTIADLKSNSMTHQQTESQSAPSSVTQQIPVLPSQEQIARSPMLPHMPSYDKLMTQAPRK